MHRREFVVGLSVAAAACSRPQEKAPAETPDAAAGAGAGPDPAAAVRPLYDPYLTQGAAFPEFRNQAPWSSDLWARLEAMSARSQALNEPILDFDPLIGAQDHQLANLNVVTEGVVENSHASVRASFTNLGRQDEIVYDLIWEGGSWRVDNIRGRDWDLRQIALQGQPATP